MLAGILGALLTTWVTFVPCFLWIFLGAPYVEGLRGNRPWRALSAITAAVVGVILNLAVWFALHVLFREVVEVEALGMTLDVPVWRTVNIASLVLTVAAVLAVFRFKIGMIPTLAACAGIGARPARSRSDTETGRLRSRSTGHSHRASRGGRARFIARRLDEAFHACSGLAGLARQRRRPHPERFRPPPPRRDRLGRKIGGRRVDAVRGLCQGY